MTVGTRFSLINNLASHSGGSPRVDICVSACPAPTLLLLATSCGFSFCQIFPPRSQKVFQAAFTSRAKKWTCEPICPIRCPSLGIESTVGLTQGKCQWFAPLRCPGKLFHGSYSLESGVYSGPAFFFRCFMHSRTLTWSFAQGLTNSILLFWFSHGRGRVPQDCADNEGGRLLNYEELWSRNHYLHWNIFFLVLSWWPLALIF